MSKPGQERISQNDTKHYARFGEEVLRCVDGLDSLDLLEINTEYSELSHDNRPVEEIMEAFLQLSGRAKRMEMLVQGLVVGFEFKTTMFGLPVRIVPIEKEEPLPGPDEAGVREPRRPIEPNNTTAQELELQES